MLAFAGAAAARPRGPPPGSSLTRPVVPLRLPVRRALAVVALLLAAAPAATPLAGQPAPHSPLAIAPDEYAARRAALAARLSDRGDGALVVVALGAPEPEADYQTFAQTPDFQYLTGFGEPDAALVVVVRPGAPPAGTLFVQPRDPAREAWTGRRAGVEGAATATGLAARPRRQLGAVLDSLAATGLPFAVVGALRGGETQTADEQFVAALRRAHPGLRVTAAAPAVAALRGRKSDAELARIRRAADVTVRAHREALGLVAPGLNEFEVQALVEYTFRRHGADRPSFATIVGSGPNATALHYNADDRVMRAGELVVMDIGASYAGYAADVTRTVPVSGRFTADQRAVYQLVRDAQAAAERGAVPGASWASVSDSARRTIADGLARLGLVDSAAATYECGPAGAPAARRCPQWALYFMHGLGHGIGLEVHDPDQGVPGGVLAPGSAFTIEPAVYVRERLVEDVIPATPGNAALRARLAPLVRRYANLGVRIEDDYVMGASGAEWISRAPREAAELEAAMAARPRGAAWRGPAPRDAALVEGYRAGW